MARVVEIKFDEVSLRRFYRRIDPDNLIEDPMDSFYNRVAETIQKKAKAKAPKFTGDLRRSIKIQKSRSFLGGLKGVAVVVRSTYGLYVHEGTRPHMPPVDALRPWASSKGISPWAVALKIAREGTVGTPFLADATEETARALPIELRVAVAGIEQNWRV